MNEFCSEILIFDHNDSYENFEQFFRLVLYRGYACAMIVHTLANQLLPQLLMEQFDTLPTQCRHIEHMHEVVLFRKNNFRQNNGYDNLDIFPVCIKNRLCLCNDSAYMRLYPPPFRYAGFRPFRRNSVRRTLVRCTPTKVQMVCVRLILCSASKMSLKPVIQYYKIGIKRI